MIDMLSKVLKKKFEKGPMKIEIHMGHDDDKKKGTDLAPEVRDKQDAAIEPDGSAPDDKEISLIHALTKGDDPDAPKPQRPPTMMEQAKGKMKQRMASIQKKKTGV